MSPLVDACQRDQLDRSIEVDQQQILDRTTGAISAPAVVVRLDAQQVGDSVVERAQRRRRRAEPR
jgi:hypothetical protein